MAKHAVSWCINTDRLKRKGTLKKKKWSTLNSQFIGLIIIVLEKADRNLYC